MIATRPTPKARILLCQKWLESERGWGTRPDGYSLHLDRSRLEKYIREYWSKMPKEVPEEYSRQDGAPYWCPVSEQIWREVVESKNGERYFGKAPWPGGDDGWISANPPRLDSGN